MTGRYKLRPDDLDWVEEERERAQKARAKMDAKIARQKLKEQLAEQKGVSAE